MQQLSTMETAIRKLGVFRVLLGSVVQFNSILFRILVGVTGGLPLKGVALVSFIEFLLNLTLEVPTGVLADKFGRVSVAVIGFVLTAGSLTSLFFALHFSGYESLSLCFLLLDGILTGVGKPMFSGAVEGFYQDAIVRAAEQSGNSTNGLSQSFTISNRYGKYGSTVAVSLAFLILSLFSHSPYVHFCFLVGASVYLIVALVLWRDYRKLGDHYNTMVRMPLLEFVPRFLKNKTLVFATFLNVVIGIAALAVLGYLIVSVGRSSVSSSSSNLSMLIYTAAFMFGFVSFGWIVKASLLPRLVLAMKPFRYLSILLCTLGASSILIALEWNDLSPVVLVGVLFFYGCVFQVVYSGLKDFSTNLILSEISRADYATGISLGNMPVYAGIIAYNLYLLILTTDGVPTVAEIFATVGALCTVAIIGAIAFYRVPILSTLRTTSIAHPLGALLILLSAGYLHASAQPKEQARITVAMDGFGRLPYQKEIPPFVAATFNSAVLGHLLYTNQSYELHSGIIKKWRWDFKEQCYHLELQEGVRFQNGRELTASDIEFSMVRGLISPTGNYYRVHFANLKGIEAISSGETFRSGMVSGIRVIDPKHLKIYLSSPNPSFLHNLSYSYLSPVAKEELIEGDPLLWKKAPVGVGPYRVTEVSESDSRVRLDAVSPMGNMPRGVDLVTGKPANAQVVLWNPVAPRTGMTRVLGDHADSIIAVLFNFNHPLGKNEKFREVISRSIDRKAIARDFDFLIPTVDFLPSHFWGRLNPKDPFNRVAARKLLMEIAKTHVGLFDKEYRIPVALSGTPDDILARLERELASLGLKVKLYRDSTKFRDKSDADTLLWVTSFAMADVDPILRFGVFREKSPVQPFMPRSDSRFEELYQEAAKASSLDVRVESVKRLSKYVFEHKLMVPLVQRKPVHWYDPNLIAGLGLQDGGGSFFLDRIEMKEQVAR